LIHLQKYNKNFKATNYFRKKHTFFSFLAVGGVSGGGGVLNRVKQIA